MGQRELLPAEPEFLGIAALDSQRAQLPVAVVVGLRYAFEVGMKFVVLVENV